MVHAVLRATPGPARGEEILWDVDEHATLFIEPDAARAGAGRITFSGAALDSLLERLAAQRIEHELIETYSNGVRYVNIPIRMGTRSRSPSHPTPRARHLDRREPGLVIEVFRRTEGRPPAPSSGSAASSRTIRSRAVASTQKQRGRWTPKRLVRIG